LLLDLLLFVFLVVLPEEDLLLSFLHPIETIVISTEATHGLIVGCAAEKSASLPPSPKLKAQS
jgi:hypothetical protein